jgi:hypothetical protein
MYFDDLEDRAGFLKMVGKEITRRFATDHDEVLLADALLDVGLSLTGDLAEAEDLLDSTNEVFLATSTRCIAGTHYEIGSGDDACLLEFGDGLAFLAFDSNEDRDRQHLIVAEVDPSDVEALRSFAVSELFFGAGATIGMTPSEIWVDSEETEIEVRKAMLRLVGQTDGPNLGLASIPTGEARQAVVDAYLDGAIWSRLELADEMDEAPGMLIGELLGLDDQALGADIDRVERELRAVRYELGERGSR